MLEFRNQCYAKLKGHITEPAGTNNLGRRREKETPAAAAVPADQPKNKKQNKSDEVDAKARREGKDETKVSSGSKRKESSAAPPHASPGADKPKKQKENKGDEVDTEGGVDPSGVTAAIALLPDDPPPDSAAWTKIKHIEDKHGGFFRFTYNRLQFQVNTKASAYRVEVAEKIARLCYAQFEKGMDKHDVLKFRAECLEKIKASPEAAALQEELAERRKMRIKEKEKRKEIRRRERIRAAREEEYFRSLIPEGKNEEKKVKKDKKDSKDKRDKKEKKETNEKTEKNENKEKKEKKETEENEKKTEKKDKVATDGAAKEEVDTDGVKKEEIDTDGVTKEEVDKDGVTKEEVDMDGIATEEEAHDSLKQEDTKDQTDEKDQEDVKTEEAIAGEDESSSSSSDSETEPAFEKEEEDEKGIDANTGKQNSTTDSSSSSSSLSDSEDEKENSGNGVASNIAESKMHDFFLECLRKRGCVQRCFAIAVIGALATSSK